MCSFLTPVLPSALWGLKFVLNNKYHSETGAIGWGWSIRYWIVSYTFIFESVKNNNNNIITFCLMLIHFGCLCSCKGNCNFQNEQHTVELRHFGQQCVCYSVSVRWLLFQRDGVRSLYEPCSSFWSCSGCEPLEPSLGLLGWTHLRCTDHCQFHQVCVLQYTVVV